jgi:D,D-heptose 1,7-bisphosphate phosphatase
MAKCVFLDRDNTIIDDPGYLTDPAAVKLLPGADQALRSLAEAGWKLVLVSNQSAIARGLLTEEGLDRVHGELRRQLRERGVNLDGIYFCPYHPDATVERYAHESPDRKPQPGMLLRAAKDLQIDLAASWMIGDAPRDVEAGQRAGCRTIRVLSKPSDDTAHPDEDVRPDYSVRNLVDAARIILGEAVPHGNSHGGPAAKPAPGAEAAPPTEAGGGQPGDDLAREVLRRLDNLSSTRRRAWLLPIVVAFQAVALAGVVLSFVVGQLHGLLSGAAIAQAVALVLVLAAGERA